MRRLLSLTILIAVILGGLWLGGETLLARKLRQVAAADPALAIGSVSELRELRRIGVRLDDLNVTRPAASLTVPGADIWVAPTSPAEGRLDLPPQILLDAGRGPMALGLQDADARLRLSLLGGLTLDSAALNAGALTLEDAALAQGLLLDADSASPGPGAPQDTEAAYDLTISLDGFDPRQLAPELPVPGLVGLAAQAQLWLDRAPGPRTLDPQSRPVLLGLRLDQADLTVGALSARIMGHLQADPQGRAQGQLVLYTPDAEALLQLAADAGWFPEKAVRLASRMLVTLGRAPIAEAGANQSMRFPEPAKGELRLPLTLSDGRMRLGPIPLGPAPIFAL